MTKVLDIPIEDIVEPLVPMRLVDKGSVDYLEMQYSIRDYGFLSSLSVRVSAKDPTKYEIIEGVWRYTVARELRLETLPCIVKDNVDDVTALLLQIQANSIRPETKPSEYANHLYRILKADPDMTMVDLAGKVRKSPDWIKNRLSLRKLSVKLKQALDRGEITMQAGLLLAKLPVLMQHEFLDSAKLLPFKEFAPAPRQALKQLKEAARQGKMKDFYDIQYKAHPYLKQLHELVTEIETCKDGTLYITVEGLTPLEAWKRALQWAVHMDPKGVEEQTVKFSSYKDQTKSNAQKRSEDRKQRKEVEDLSEDWN